MTSTPMLATRFARNSRVLRSAVPLTEDQLRATAPSVFAQGKHVSRSERYTYIPTIDVLRGLRNAGFEPFMVAQGASRVEGKADYTKHLVRMRHASHAQGRPEAFEIILINSHDGASCYQMLAGVTPFAGSAVDVAIANMSKDPPPIYDRAAVEADPLLERFTRRLMARDAEQRFPSAAIALSVLELIERDPQAAGAALGITDAGRAMAVVALPSPPRSRGR